MPERLLALLPKLPDSNNPFTEHAPNKNSLRALIPVMCDSMDSIHSRRVYYQRLELFFASPYQFSREGIQLYLKKLREENKSSSTINVSMAALRKLLDEAEMKGLISEKEARAIRYIHRDRAKQVRFGNWLTFEGAKKLVGMPDRKTVQGKRDAAIFAMLLGVGLRRDEAARVKWGQYQEREGRMLFVDVKGKGRKLRTVAVSDWAKRDLDQFKAQIIIQEPDKEPFLERLNVLRRIENAGGIVRHHNLPPKLGRNLTSAGIWYVVSSYADRLGIKMRPHDLRRTLAKLMRRTGAPLEQIQFQLGHASVLTTELYLGGSIELLPGKAGVDGVRLGAGDETED